MDVGRFSPLVISRHSFLLMTSTKPPFSVTSTYNMNRSSTCFAMMGMRFTGVPVERRVLSLGVAPNASVRVGTLGTADPRHLALWRAAPGIIGRKEASLPQPVWHPASPGGRVTGSDPSLQEPRGGCVSVFPSVIWVHAAHLGMRRCCRANLGAQHEKYSLCYSFYNRQLPKQLRCVP